jgi:hypothetical protein
MIPSGPMAFPKSGANSFGQLMHKKLGAGTFGGKEVYS